MGTPGFRTREITLGTTRLDAEAHCGSDLAELYRQRWQVETALAQLKTTMQMDVLHGQTVPGVLKELTMFAIVYNLVRLVTNLANISWLIVAFGEGGGAGCSRAVSS